MTAKLSLAVLALATVAAQASAQARTSDRVRDRVIVNSDGRVERRDAERRRAEERREEARRAEARREEARRAERRREKARNKEAARTAEQRGPKRIPPGHLPPPGKCRVWIDGVPPGRQPAVTDCATAERNRTANSRVIYGDRESFPGKGRGKIKNRERADRRDCRVRDAVVIDGRVVNVCRDDERRERRRNERRHERDDDSDSDSDSR